MRQRPQNALEGASEEASARFPDNQYLESAVWLTNPCIARSGAPEDTSLVGFPRRASLGGPASLSSRCP